MWISKKKFEELSKLPFGVRDYAHLDNCIRAATVELEGIRAELRTAKDSKNRKDLEIRAKEVIEDPTIEIELTGHSDNGALIMKYSIISTKVGSKAYVHCQDLREVKAYLDGYAEFKFNGKRPL